MLFLLPAMAYAAFKLLTLQPGASMAAALSRMPVLPLSLLGACLVAAVLALAESSGGGKPGQAYEPAQVSKDGQFIPGRMK